MKPVGCGKGGGVAGLGTGSGYGGPRSLLALCCNQHSLATSHVLSCHLIGVSFICHLCILWTGVPAVWPNKLPFHPLPDKKALGEGNIRGNRGKIGGKRGKKGCGGSIYGREVA